MNKIKNVCLLLILSFSVVISQDLQIQWSKTYDYKSGHNIDFSHDGGFFFTNSIEGIVKIDNQGAVQDVWRPDSTYVYSVYNNAQKCNEGYIIIGTINDDKIKVILKKLDNQGRQEWKKYFSRENYIDYEGAEIHFQDEGKIVKQTRDNGYILLSEGLESDSFYFDSYIWLVKTDPYGKKEWDHEIGVDSGYIKAIHQTSDDGYLVAYNEYDDYDRDSGILLRLTSDGQRIWKKEYDELLEYVLPADDGGFFIGGNIYSRYNLTQNTSQLKKVDKNGDEIWKKTFHYESAGSRLNSMIKLDDNSYLSSGYIYDSGSQSTKGWLIKTDSLGNEIWEKTFVEIDNIIQALQISQNEFILLGNKGGYTTIIKAKEYIQQGSTILDLLEPVNYKMGVGTQLCLDWTIYENASSYLIEIDDNIDMSSPFISKTVSSNSNCIINGLSYSTQYFWRVRANLPDGSDHWSNTSSFKTMRAPSIEFNLPEGYCSSYVDVGDQYYTDREYTITELPEPLKNCLWIKTQNSDKYLTDDDYIQFQLTRDATIYIAYDNRASAVPHWLLSGFEQTGYTIQSSDDESTFNIWKGRFPAGDVTLGANSATGAEGVQTNYIVLIDIPIQMLDPRDNKSGIGNDVIFSWETPGNFGSYDLQISENQNMSSPLQNINNILSPRYLLKGLDYNKDYYWRVKAHNRNDENAWHETQRIHTMDYPKVSIYYNRDNQVLAWIEENDQYYIDCNDVVISIPDQLKNLLWIKTANNKATLEYDSFEIHLGNKATIYVGFDSRATSLPNWVTDNYRNTGLTIKVSDEANELNIWSRNVDKGSVYMSTIMAEGAENIKSNYVVLIDTNQVQPLLADFGSDVTTGVLPLTVNLADSSKGFITSWFWDFGDGTTSTEKNPSHTFKNSGNYTVSLTINGPDSSDTIMKENYISVKNVIGNFSADVTMGQAPLTVSFTDSSLGEIDAWLWKFGDGLTSTAQNPSHVYTSGDSFTVSLFVRGPGGSNTIVKTNFIIVDHPTSINDMAGIPDKFDLLPNYPNPFNPQTTIRFAVPKKSFVKITIFDINGKLVQNLFSGTKNPGHYAITWNASGFSSGMYFIKMDTDSYSSVRKCILVK